MSSKISLADPPCFHTPVVVIRPSTRWPGRLEEARDEVTTRAGDWVDGWRKMSRQERIATYRWWLRYHNMCVRAAERGEPQPDFPA